MATTKVPIFKVKLPFYHPCEVKCGLQNGVSIECPSLIELEKRISMYEKDTKLCNQYLSMVNVDQNVD